MLLESLKRKGLPSVIPPDFQEAQDLLGRLGYVLIIKTLLYDLVTGRSLQTAPKDTSKEIYLKMIIHGWREAMRSLKNDLSTASMKKIEEDHGINDVIWVRMDMDTAMKSLALGFLP